MSADVKIVVAYLYETLCKMDEIKKICDVHYAVILEEVAKFLGEKYKEMQIGTHNAISFNGNKIIIDSSGDILLADHKETAEKWDDVPLKSGKTRPGISMRKQDVISDESCDRGDRPGTVSALGRVCQTEEVIYDRY